MGAAMVLRRELWDELGGFEPRYFAYHEDVELCRRCWHRGLELVNVPGAVAVHRYEFGREPSKVYLSERNRLLFDEFLVLAGFELLFRRRLEPEQSRLARKLLEPFVGLGVCGTEVIMGKRGFDLFGKCVKLFSSAFLIPRAGDQVH